MKWAIQRELVDRIRRPRTTEREKQQHYKKGASLRETSSLGNYSHSSSRRPERPREHAGRTVPPNRDGDSAARPAIREGLFCATAATTAAAAADTCISSSRSHSSGGLLQPPSNDVLTSHRRTGRKRDILAEHAKRRAAFSAAALVASGTITTTTTTTAAEILAGHGPKRPPVRRSASNMDADLRDVASVVDGTRRREFFNAAIAASTAAAAAAKPSERQPSFLRRTVSSGDALREAPFNKTRSEQQPPGSTTAQFEPSRGKTSGSSRLRRAAGSTDDARRGSTRLQPASTPRRPLSEATLDAGDMTLPTSPQSPPSVRRTVVRRCKSSAATPSCPWKDAAGLCAGIDAPGSTQSHDWWLSGLGTMQGGCEEAKGESPDGRGCDGDISARPRNRERLPGRLHGTAAGASIGFLPADSRATAGAGSRRSRPRSLGSRTLSQSSFDEAIRVQEEIDQAIEAEEMQATTGRRRDRKGIKERSSTAADAGNNREAQRQPRCFSRPRSSQQEGSKLEPRAEEEEGEGWRPVRRPLSSLTTASSATRRGNRTVSTKGHKKEEAGGGLRRSLSTGSARLPRPSESRDGVDENQNLQQKQQQQQQRNSRQRERIVIRREDEAADMEIEKRSDTQVFRAGRGGVSLSVAMNISPSVSARSHGRSQRRSRAAKWERRGGYIGQRPATPEAQPAEDAAMAAASAASAATSAAASAVVAADAAAAAMETAGVLFAEEPLSSPSASPPVWVARHLDCSDSHGLVFLMSDGSVGLLFKDHAKMVVDPAGVTFDYIEPPSSSSTAAVALHALPSSTHEAESGAGEGKESVRYSKGDAPDCRHYQQQRYQYSLDHFPFYLRKKVKALRFVWESLMSDHDGGADGGGGANSSRAALGRQQSVTTAGTRGNPSSEWAAERQELHNRQTLTFIEKWQRAGDTHWFQLSDQTVQVLFSDDTEILLSKDRRLVTFVDGNGKRETHPRQWVESRTDVMKRVRCAEDFMFLSSCAPKQKKEKGTAGNDKARSTRVIPRRHSAPISPSSRESIRHTNQRRRSVKPRVGRRESVFWGGSEDWGDA